MVGMFKDQHYSSLYDVYWFLTKFSCCLMITSRCIHVLLGFFFVSLACVQSAVFQSVFCLLSIGTSQFRLSHKFNSSSLNLLNVWIY
jgi:hypothetical protein